MSKRVLNEGVRLHRDPASYAISCERLDSTNLIVNSFGENGGTIVNIRTFASHLSLIQLTIASFVSNFMCIVAVEPSPEWPSNIKLETFYLFSALVIDSDDFKYAYEWCVVLLFQFTPFRLVSRLRLGLIPSG